MTQDTMQAAGSTNNIFNKEIRFDAAYFKTPNGVLKTVIVVLNVLALICILSSAFRSNSRGVFFIIISILGFWFSCLLLVCYMLHVVEKYYKIKWLKIEMIGDVVLTFLNLIVSTIALAFGDAGYSAAGFFGYLVMVSYGVEAYLRARALQAGELAQGARVAAKQAHVTQPEV